MQKLCKVSKNNENTVLKYKDRLELFSNICKNNKQNFVLTDGDAGGNVIINDNNFTIIDWDEVSLTSMERDI